MRYSCTNLAHFGFFFKYGVLHVFSVYTYMYIFIFLLEFSNPCTNLRSTSKLTYLRNSVYFCFQFACQLCYGIYKSKQYLTQHLRATHKIGGGYKCVNCGKDDFNSVKTYQRHKKKCVATASTADQLNVVCVAADNTCTAD